MNDLLHFIVGALFYMLAMRLGLPRLMGFGLVLFLAISKELFDWHIAGAQFQEFEPLIDIAISSFGAFVAALLTEPDKNYRGELSRSKSHSTAADIDYTDSSVDLQTVQTRGKPKKRKRAFVTRCKATTAKFDELVTLPIEDFQEMAALSEE